MGVGISGGPHSTVSIIVKFLCMLKIGRSLPVALVIRKCGQFLELGLQIDRRKEIKQRKKD